MEEPHRIIQSDVISFLLKNNEEPFDIIFADPPFTEEMAHDVVRAAAKSKLFKPSTILTIESGRREKIEDDYGSLIRYDVRQFGDKFLSFYKLKE